MSNEFSVHLLNELGLNKAYAVADAFNILLDKVNDLIPSGRERALVVTKLQEAAFFAKRSISIDPANQK